MFRNFVIAAVIALGIVGWSASKPTSTTAGSWRIDTRHSDVQLITDAATDYGKTKTNVTLGFGSSRRSRKPNSGKSAPEHQIR